MARRLSSGMVAGSVDTPNGDSGRRCPAIWAQLKIVFAIAEAVPCKCWQRQKCLRCNSFVIV